MTYAERIRSLREQRGLSKRELAEKAGIAPQLIYKYESGQIDQLTIKTIKKLCDALGVSQTDFLGWKTQAQAVETTYRVTVYSKLSGLDPVPLSDDAVGHVDVNAADIESRDDLLAIKLDDSSLLPSVLKDDIAVIKRQREVDGTKPAAVIINGGDVIIRRVQFTQDGLRCTTLDGGESQDFKWRDIEDRKIQIFGTCLEIRRIY